MSLSRYILLLFAFQHLIEKQQRFETSRTPAWNMRDERRTRLDTK